MRRALLKSWPAITRFYGFHPWDIERLTVDELNEYLRQMDAHHRAQQQAAAKARRQSPTPRRR